MLSSQFSLWYMKALNSPDLKPWSLQKRMCFGILPNSFYQVPTFRNSGDAALTYCLGQ